MIVASDHPEFWLVRAREAAPVSKASEDLAELGTSNEAPETPRAVGVVVVGGGGGGIGELGFVNVTVWPCKNCTPPSRRASEANDELVQRDVSVADEIGRPADKRRFSSFASSNGSLALSVGLVGLCGSGTAAAPAPAPRDTPDCPILTSPACPWCSSTRRTPWPEAGVMI